MKSAKKHSGLFSYNGNKIPFSYWLNIEEGDAPDTVIFLGAGAVGAVPRMVANRAGAGVVVVDGVPHWHADSSGSDIPEFSKSYFLSAYQTILDALGLTSLHIIGESQAAPAPVLLSISSPKNVRNIALIRPLGFTVKAFGDTPDARMKAFRKRILQTYLQLPQSFLHDPRNLLVSLTVIRAMLSESTVASLDRKYAAGISYDLLKECKLAAKLQRDAGNTFTLILGEKDKMFPPKEIIAALESLKTEGIDIVIVPGDTHSSLAVRASERVLRTALRKVRMNDANR
jgi:pimeloyl-ACP methyl ester carboxylesterase